MLKERVGRFAVECVGRHDSPRQFFKNREEAIDASRAMCTDVMIRDVTLEDVFIDLTGERIDI